MTRRFFGTDGIRDVAGEGLLAPGHVRAYGRALGALLAKRAPRARVLAGRDTRRSGPEILDLLAEGVLGAGHHLVDGGVLTTPAVQALVREEDFHLALVISASHNPACDNGIKFFGPDGRKLPDEDERALEALADRALGDGAPVTETPGGRGVRTPDPDAGERYLRFLQSRLSDLDLTGVRVVLDCSHGAASRLAPEALRRFGAELRVVGASPDGSNINEGAGVSYVKRLIPLVKEHGADLAMALDGDADRVLLVDETGQVRDGDHMLGILARDLHARGQLPGNRLVTTVMANLGLKVHVKQDGIVCEMVPVGDRYVAACMAETGAALGGEQSGHIIFRSGDCWFGDGVYTALRILQVMRRRSQPLSLLAQGIEKLPQILVNVRVREKPPLERLPVLRSAVEGAERELGEEGRVLLRYSGTEPLLRVMVEGRRLEQVRSLSEAIAEVARKALGA